MPYHIPYSYYSFSHNTEGTSGYISVTAAQIRQQFEEYRYRCEQQERMMEQQMREAEEQCYQESLRQKEMEKYPLFFWRELAKDKE